MTKELDFNEVIEFMKEFKIDYLNRFGELIIDEQSNTYANINECKDIEDVKTRVVFNLCRPIGEGLDEDKANLLLYRLNSYFNTGLTQTGMLLMYEKLCYREKLDEFKQFIQNGFPIYDLI